MFCIKVDIVILIYKMLKIESTILLQSLSFQPKHFSIIQQDTVDIRHWGELYGMGITARIDFYSNKCAVKKNKCHKEA